MTVTINETTTQKTLFSAFPALEMKKLVLVGKML